MICDTLHITAYSDTNHDGTKDTLRVDWVPTVDQVEQIGVSIPTGFTDIDFVPRYASGAQGVIVMAQAWYLPWVATAGVGADAFATLECSAPTPSPSRRRRSAVPRCPRPGAWTRRCTTRVAGWCERCWTNRPRRACTRPGDGRAADGARAQATGVYFVRIAAGGSVATRKLVRVN